MALVGAVVKICVNGEGACWVCERCLTDRCCVHLYNLPLCQQEQVRSQLHSMQIARQPQEQILAPKPVREGPGAVRAWCGHSSVLGERCLWGFGSLEEVSSLFVPSFPT